MTTPEPASEGRLGWLTSVAFWSCLVFAAACFAVVSLAPKLLTCVELTQQHHANQLQLVALEQDDQRVQKIIKALKEDPRYVRELARQDFAAGIPGENSIPLDEELALDGRPSAPKLQLPEPELPWYTPVVALVARDSGITTSLLIVSAVVVVYAFAFLQPSR